MPFRFASPGCCCCNNIYHGGATVSMHKIGTFDGSRYAETPDTAFSGFCWTLDHYHEKLFVGFEAGTTTVASTSMLLPPDADDIVLTEVVDYTSSFFLERMCTASEDGKLYYVLSESPTTTTYYFKECDFDGANDATVFSRTMASASSALLQRIEHCRYNDRLYYMARKSGDTYFKLYACDRDGSNDALVLDKGASNPAIGSTRGTFCFDNVRGKLYVAQRATGSPYSGQIVRMDLDGTNQETVYDTGEYLTPFIIYGVYAVRFSHSKDSLYWVEGSNATENSSNSSDPDSGLYTATYDGSNPTQLTGRYELGLSGTTTPTIADFDIGCGYETLGTATEA